MKAIRLGLKQVFREGWAKARKKGKREHGSWFAMMHGLEIAFSPYVRKRHVQFRFPRTKKRRTRKKWAKKPANWHTVYDSYVIGGKTLIMHEDQRIHMEGFGYHDMAPTMERWVKGK